MTIFRGPGGTGSATSDSDTTEFQEFLVQSQAARDAALAAQAAAELAETNAETAETNAETAETNAETAATNAASSASAASTSASNAATSASNAASSATSAANSASAAAASAASINPADIVHISGTETITGAKTFSQTITGSITGNAGTATNGVVTTGSYADPAWITSLAGSKVSGNITGNAANVTGTVAVANGGTGSTTASTARTALGLVIGTDVLPVTNPSYTGTLTGGTGVVDLGSGQFYKGASGNVGIGVTPTYKFQVNSGDTQFAIFNESGTWTANGGLVLAGYYAGTTLIGGVKVSAATTSSGYVSFHTGGTTERARFDTSGNFLVNTTSVADNSIVNFAGNATVTQTGECWYHTNVTNGGTNQKRYRWGSLNSGVFLIQTVTDAYNSATTRLQIDPNGYLSVQGVYNLTTAAGANVHVAADGTMYRSTSSLKYKTDVQNATHGLAEVMALRPVTYKGKNDGELVFGGLIAEEVHEAGLSEFVQYSADGTPDALAYANMVSLAFKAIQEQQAIILAQESALNALTARVAALETAAI